MKIILSLYNTNWEIMKIITVPTTKEEIEKYLPILIKEAVIIGLHMQLTIINN